MGQLSALPNIGKVIEDQLNTVGIETPEQLSAIGSKEAWLKIQTIDASACIQRLYALEGAILGIKDNNLPPDIKADLKAFYNAYK